jgi:hypothetical protein
LWTGQEQSEESGAFREHVSDYREHVVFRKSQRSNLEVVYITESVFKRIGGDNQISLRDRLVFLAVKMHNNVKDRAISTERSCLEMSLWPYLYRVFSQPMDSAHISTSAYTRIAANRWCYQARNKQYASLTLSIGCANTLY